MGGVKDQIGFLEVLEKIVKVWKDQQQKCLTSASDILKQLKDFTDEGLKGGEGEGLELDLLEEAYQHFMARYDPLYGGFGSAPKFPTPVNLAFLLRLGTFPATVQDIVGEMECRHAKSMVITTLEVCLCRIVSRKAHVLTWFLKLKENGKWWNTRPHRSWIFQVLCYWRLGLTPLREDALRSSTAFEHLS